MLIDWFSLYHDLYIRWPLASRNPYPATIWMDKNTRYQPNIRFNTGHDWRWGWNIHEHIIQQGQLPTRILAGYANTLSRAGNSTLAIKCSVSSSYQRCSSNSSSASCTIASTNKPNKPRRWHPFTSGSAASSLSAA